MWSRSGAYFTSWMSNSSNFFDAHHRAPGDWGFWLTANDQKNKSPVKWLIHDLLGLSQTVNFLVNPGLITVICGDNTVTDVFLVISLSICREIWQLCWRGNARGFRGIIYFIKTALFISVPNHNMTSPPGPCPQGGPPPQCSRVL